MWNNFRLVGKGAKENPCVLGAQQIVQLDLLREGVEMM